MDSLKKYESDEETDKMRDVPSPIPSSSSTSQRKHKNAVSYGNIGSSGYKRTATDDTNYESVHMDMSEANNMKPSLNKQSSKQENRERKEKNGKSDRDRNRERNRDNDRKEFRNDREKFSNSRKSRDEKDDRRERDGKDRLEKDENRRETKEKEREKEKERDRDREKEKAKEFDRKSATQDEHRRKSNSNDRKEKLQSKSKSRSRSRERNPYRAPGPSNAFDRRKEKVQQLEKMGIDYSNSANKTGIELPVYYNPGAVNPVKYADQVQKRKLLWGHKKNEQEQAAKWETAKFTADSDGKVASKFMRLMGIKDAPPKSTGESSNSNSSGPDLVKKQEELFSTMEQQYEVARQVTHTMRGVGLGFGGQQRPF